MVFIHNGILYSYKTEGNITTSDSMDGFWGHYAKWKKSQTVNDKTVWSLLYVESERKRKKREQIGGCQRSMGRVRKIGWVSQT